MPDATYVGAGMPCGNCGNPLTPGQPHKCGRVGNPYAPSSDWKPGQDTFTAQAAGIWDEGFAAGRAADRNTEGVWPDQSAMHGVLLDQIKDAYAEGIADTIDRLRVRAAEMLPEVARFTLDEIEVAAVDLSASSTAEKLASPRKHSASASDPMPLCVCGHTDCNRMDERNAWQDGFSAADSWWRSRLESDETVEPLAFYLATVRGVKDWQTQIGPARAVITSLLPVNEPGCRAPHCWNEYGTPCATCPVNEPETDT